MSPSRATRPPADVSAVRLLVRARNPFRTLGEMQSTLAGMDLARMIRSARRGYLPSVARVRELAKVLRDTEPLDVLIAFAADAELTVEGDREGFTMFDRMRTLTPPQRRHVYGMMHALIDELERENRSPRTG